MVQITAKRSKTKQYVIGGAVSVVILCAWISIPLMQSSSMDSSVAPANFFKTRVADVGSLGNDIPQEGGAPGYALNGEMLNNPVTSGENIASSLFQSGMDEETAPAETPAADSAGSQPPVSNTSASAGAPDPSFSGSRGKLTPVSSIAGGNSNSMTAGAAHNKFFGSGAAKTDFAPVSDQGFKNAAADDKRGTLTAMLQKTAEKSAQAARSSDLASAASGATSAFEKIVKANTSSLNNDAAQSAASSGLSLGAAAQDLKRNDPQINKKNVTLPTPKPLITDDERAKQMLIQIVMQLVMSSLMGPMFGTMAGMSMSGMGGAGTSGMGTSGMGYTGI